MTPGQRLMRRQKAEANRRALQRAIEINAEKLRHRAPFFVDQEDLIAEGWRGALEALQSYDPSRGATKVTWAGRCAWGAMMHYLRNEAKLRGVPGRMWERGDGDLREAPMEAAARIGNDGLADRVAAKHLAEMFTAEQAGDSRAICEAVLAGAESLNAALPAGRDFGGWHTAHKQKLQLRLRGFMLRGKHKEGLVI